MPRDVRAEVGPHAPSLPPGVWIVDATVEPPRVEAQGVRHPHPDPFAGLGIQGQKRIGSGAVGNGYVLSQPQRVELVHPVVVVEISTSRGFCILHPRSRSRVESPPLDAVLPRGFRPDQHGALAPIEAGQVAAPGERRPDDSVPGNIDSPGRESPVLFGHIRVLEGRLVHLGRAGRRWVVPEHQTIDPARYPTRPGDPDGVVHRAHDDAIGEARELRVQVRIPGITRVPGPRDPPVAVGVDDRGAPALGHLGPGRQACRSLVPNLIHEGTRWPVQQGGGSYPADDPTVAAEVERIFRVLSELEVVGPEAGVDEREFLRVWMEHRSLPPAVGEREILRIGVGRALPAPIRVVPADADPRREPHPPVLVHHRVVDIGGAVQHDLLSPEHRRLEAGGGGEVGGGLGVPHGHTQVAGFVGIGVHDQQSIIRHGDGVDVAAGVDRRVTFVRSDLVVNVGGPGTPVPQREHHVPLLSLGPGGERGDLAGYDPVRPIRELLNRPLSSHS